VGGRTPTHDLREVFNAILYVNRTGIAWRYLPHDLPPYQTVYGYFAAWTREGIFTELNYQLTGLVRDNHGRQTCTPSTGGHTVRRRTRGPRRAQHDEWDIAWSDPTDDGNASRISLVPRLEGRTAAWRARTLMACHPIVRLAARVDETVTDRRSVGH